MSDSIYQSLESSKSIVSGKIVLVKAIVSSLTSPFGSIDVFHMLEAVQKISDRGGRPSQRPALSKRARQARMAKIWLPKRNPLHNHSLFLVQRAGRAIQIGSPAAGSYSCSTVGLLKNQIYSQETGPIGSKSSFSSA